MKETFADFSIPVIEKKFEKFNIEYFEGKLTKPMFVLKVCKNTLGRCNVRTKECATKPTIMLSTYYNVKEVEMETTLIHEMIHLYQYQVLKEPMNHKDSFRRMSAKIANLSQGDYFITRTTSRQHCSLSVEGKQKKEKRDLNKGNPIILICKETNEYGEEFAWLIRLSNKLAERFYRGTYYLSNSFKVLGFIYDKPQDWMYATRVCRQKVTSGKKMQWREFNKLHSKDILSLVKPIHEATIF